MDKEEIKKEKEETLIGERRIEFSEDSPSSAEKKEISSENENVVKEYLRREIELMEADESLKEEAKKKAKKVEFLGEKEKIEKLLEIAKEKGVIFAIKVAEDMNDPFLLDTLHDILAQEGYYKKITK